jgi:hypothetical protein
VDINLQDATRLGVNEEKQPVVVKAPQAIHQPFSWLHASVKGDENAELAALTQTVCNGMFTCLQLVLQSRLAQDNGDVPLLGANDAESLLLLAAASAQLLGEAAEDHIDTLTGRAMKEVAA